MAFSMVSTGFLDKIAMNRQMIATQSLESGSQIIAGATGAIQGAWNEDYTTFQNLGSAAAGVTSGAVNIGLTAGLGFAMHHGARSMVGDLFRSIARRPEAQYIDNVSKYKGMMFAKGANGGMLGANSATIDYMNDMRNRFAVRPTHGTQGPMGYAAAETRVQRAAGMAASKGKQGVLRMTGSGEGRFIGRSPLMTGWGGAASMAAFIAVPMMANAAFGMAGKLLDEAHMSYQSAKYHHLDTRDFNNRQMYEWNMNKQNSMMSNMMPYENNMMSMARAYHSR